MQPQRGSQTLRQPPSAPLAWFERVRQQSVALCEPLEIEDFGVQPMDDASPPKWHLAHTTWFFETFLLKPFLAGYEAYHPQYEHLFNSYYNGVGQPFPRPRRGHLSRPTVAQVLAYRRQVDEAMFTLMSDRDDPALVERLELGLHHERQHQELLLTDLKYNFGNNPLYPVYRTAPESGATTASKAAEPVRFVSFPGGMVEVGAQEGFAFDNERPRHRVYLEPFHLADRLVTNAEFTEFIDDGGYQKAELWLSEGWQAVQERGWQAPLYWLRRDDEWAEYRLDGLHPLDGDRPVVHVSAHEAYAFATWSGHRLPTEFEWEVAAECEALAGNFVETGFHHPVAAGRAEGVKQLYGDVWEWTASSYGPYPGYAPLPGTLGEYNGKFMSSQLVLRGGSCASAQDHIRSSYRNFFYPPDRWQFTGLRLAKNA